MCQYCDQPLNKSIYKFDKESQTLLKSCPSCSVKAGFHVFYAAPEEFGCSKARVNTYNPTGIQSHCKHCRAKHPVPSNTKRVSCMPENSPNHLIFQQEFEFRV